jgi:hypothetical protein
MAAKAQPAKPTLAATSSMQPLAVIAHKTMHRLIFIVILIQFQSCLETNNSISRDKSSIKQINDTTEIELKEYNGKIIKTYFNYNRNHELKSKTEYITFEKRIFQIDTLPHNWYRNHFFHLKIY